MYRKFKTKEISKLSNAKRYRIRKRSTNITARLKVFYDFLNAKTKEEMDKAVAKILSEVDDLGLLMQSGYWRKLPRKKKKREKQLICDYYNAYALIPELAFYIKHNQDE